MRRLQWLGPLLIVAVWIIARGMGLLNPTLLPDFFETVKHLGQLLWPRYTNNVLQDFGESMARMSIGYSVSVIVGIPLGIAIGFFPRLYETFEIPLDFFRSIPVTTLYPLFVLLFGIGHNSKIAMVVAACIFVITLNTAYGVMQRKVVRTQVAQLFGASKLQLLKERRWI